MRKARARARWRRERRSVARHWPGDVAHAERGCARRRNLRAPSSIDRSKFYLSACTSGASGADKVNFFIQAASGSNPSFGMDVHPNAHPQGPA
eukprot:6194121-Pleurochrysis_carterae.AAC.1